MDPYKDLVGKRVKVIDTTGISSKWLGCEGIVDVVQLSVLKVIFDSGQDYFYPWRLRLTERPKVIPLPLPG
jgi:hypothetical protein